MNELINLGLENIDFKEVDFLIKYYRDNKDTLRKITSNNNIDYYIISNNKGWITFINSNTEVILQGWAGEIYNIIN